MALLALSPTLEERFWPKVNVRGFDECWPWLASIDSKGYGQITVGSRKTRKFPVRAHCVVFELANGPIPTGLHVLHTCDFKICCNPRHLYVGTHDDNMRDNAARTSARGESSGMVILTELQVQEIRKRYATGGVTQKVLGGEYKVSQTTISDIITGRRWGWLS